MALPDPGLWAAFLAAATILVLTPGPDMAYVAARTLGSGRAVGFAAVAGIQTGGLVHALLSSPTQDFKRLSPDRRGKAQ